MIDLNRKKVVVPYNLTFHLFNSVRIWLKERFDGTVRLIIRKKVVESGENKKIKG